MLYLSLCTLLLCCCINNEFVNGFIPTNARSSTMTSLHMGFGDMLKKAMANDPNLTPAKNPGLSKEPETIILEFSKGTEFKKEVKAIKGQALRDVAASVKAPIRYQCKKGECRTCEVSFDGKVVKACQSFIGQNTPSKVKVIIPLTNAPPKNMI